MDLQRDQQMINHKPKESIIGTFSVNNTLLKMKESNIIKFLEAYNRFFTNQEKTDFKNVEILFLTRDESERRIIAGN